jgi:phosphatidylglycerophosphate synthase
VSAGPSLRGVAAERDVPLIVGFVGSEKHPARRAAYDPAMLAHALTGLRLALVVPLLWAMQRPDAGTAVLAGVLLALGIASDLLDGPIARWQGSASAFGRLFDHLTDVSFVAAGLCGGALRGAFPWLLPLLVVAAFAQYLLDSLWLRRGGALVMSGLGRWNGILYFVPLGADVLARAILPGLSPVISAICWMLIASTLVSMADRARALLVGGRGW